MAKYYLLHQIKGGFSWQIKVIHLRFIWDPNLTNLGVSTYDLGKACGKRCWKCKPLHKVGHEMIGKNYVTRLGRLVDLCNKLDSIEKIL